MRVIHKLTVHLDDRRHQPELDMMQLDADTRVLELTLMAGGVAWEVPSGMSVSVAFRKSDGHGGWYDLLPDKSKACKVSGNVVTAVLAPEVLTCAGKTEVAVIVQDPSTLDQIAAFPVTVMVARNPAAGQGLSEDYYKYTTMADVVAALDGMEESLRPVNFSLSATNAEKNGWSTIRDLPANRIYRLPHGDHPVEFGLPYEGNKQTILAVLGTGNSSWYTMYVCADRDGAVWIAYDDPASTEKVRWMSVGDDPADVQKYLRDLASRGQTVARFRGTHVVKEKIGIPAGMTIMGGTFIADSKFEDAIFAAGGDGCRLVGVTLKAPALGKVPDIYAKKGEEPVARDSNVMGLYSDGYEGIAMIGCVCDKIKPAKINNGSGIIHGCRITDCSMFVYGTNVRLTVSDNDVAMNTTGLDYYYHVYYLDQNSELVASHNRIRCDADVAFWDVYHLMTAENNGRYHASGIIDGDVVIGNFQHIIDCHHADLTLKDCTIVNTNTKEWTEIQNWGHVTYRHEGCTLDYRGSVAGEEDIRLHANAAVTYDRCRIMLTAPLNMQRVYRDCVIEQELTGASVLSDHSDVFNCHFRVSGTPNGIAIAEEEIFEWDFVGNTVEFLDAVTNQYLFKCPAFTGSILNNCIYGANGTVLWETDRGRAHNNYINGEVAT